MSDAGGEGLPALLKFLVEAESWQSRATCRIEQADPDEFILEQGRTATSTRKKYCSRCPVREECLAYGIRTNSVGVWGGQVLGSRNATPVSPMQFFQDARPLSHLVDPPPLKAHQVPDFLFK